ncbi:GDP-mannose 4,6-dehydratase [Candidatus Woesearchaeota archaeon]|nr:GDP-mannose 4,6-dehydratase [Candidatus Woesearchaeota archaeon]
MKAFITGINGFVGKHLSALLLSRGFEVHGIDLSDSFDGDSKVNYQKADLLAPEELNQLMLKIKPDYIIHLAGFSSVKKSFEQPELCRKINVTGTKNLLDAVLSAKINPKILIITSADIYGTPKSVPIPETAELNPVSPYAESRKEQEEICKQYMEKLQIIISRSFPHIGPGQAPIFVTSDFAKQIVEIEKGKEPTIKTGNLEAKRDFTDVRDVVKAYLLALEKCKPGETYNICSGKEYSIKEILDMLLSLSQAEIKIEQDPDRMRPSDIPILQGDNSKFKEQTGWSPEIPIETTLKDILDYWRNNI